MTRLFTGKRITGPGWPLAAVTAAGLVLRLYGLGVKDLWVDEHGSLDQAASGLTSLFHGFYLPPFYFFLLKLWTALSGFSAVSCRMLSALAGAASIVLLYRVGKKLFDERAGLAAAVILALSPFHLFYSQEARQYAVFVFLTLLSVFLFIRIVQKGAAARPRLYVYYALSLSALLYTHTYGLLVLCLLNLAFFRAPASRKPWLLAQAAVLLVFLPWLIPYLARVRETVPFFSRQFSWIPRPGLMHLADTFATFSAGTLSYDGGPSYTRFIQYAPTAIPVLYFMLVFFIAGIVLPSSNGRKNTGFALFWFLFPVAALFAGSYFLAPVYVTRYLIFAAPAYYLLTGRGMAAARGKLFVCLILIFGVLSFSTLGFYYRRPLKPEWGKAIEYIRQHGGPDDVVIVSPAINLVVFNGAEEYRGAPRGKFRFSVKNNEGEYLTDGGFIVPYRGLNLAGVNSREQLETLEARGRLRPDGDIWFVSSRWLLDDKFEQMRAYLAGQEREKETTVEFEGLRFFHYGK